MEQVVHFVKCYRVMVPSPLVMASSLEEMDSRGTQKKSNESATNFQLHPAGCDHV
jgi:hypothetical protein